MILIADKSDRLIRQLKRTRYSHQEFVRLNSYADAVRHVGCNTIHAAIISQHLSDALGYELLCYLQTHDSRIPVIYIAEDSRKESILSAMRGGARDFLVWPVDANALEESLTRIVLTPPPKEDRSSNKQGSGSSRKGRTPKPAFPDAKSNPGCDLDVSFLGDFNVYVNGNILDHWPSKKGKSIFAYLIYHHGKNVRKDILTEQLWPNVFPESARNCLNVAIHHIRQLLHDAGLMPNVIILNNESYCINPEVNLSTDVKRFLSHWNRARFLIRDNQIHDAADECEMAVSIYHGDFRQGDNYDEWTAIERENLREIYLEVLENLSGIYSSIRKYETAIDLCKSILEKDSCREKVHRRLMSCYYLTGQRDNALRQYRKCSTILKQELDVGPSAETVELFKKIRNDDRDISHKLIQH